jgi:hypothetical protein
MLEFFFRKSCLLWDNVEKHGAARQAAYDNIMLRGKHALSMPENLDKDTDTRWNI